MKKRKWTMREALLLFCIGSMVLALLMQTFLFQQSLRRQIRTEIISDYELSLNKMQSDLASFIFRVRSEMLTIYTERDLIDSMQQAAKQETSLKEYYWRSWYFAMKRFSREDRLLALYLYDVHDHLISAYRSSCVAYPRNLYQAEYDTNWQKVEEYVHGEDTNLLISGYYNPQADKNITRFVLKMHNYDQERSPIGYLVCDIDSTALETVMEKYVDLEQVCLWLQPVGDQAISVTGKGTEDQKRLTRQLSRVIENYYASSSLDAEYEGYYLIQVGQENYNLEAFVLVSQSLLTATQKSLLRSLLTIMAGMIFVLAGLVFGLSRWITRPVEEMRNTIIQIKNGATHLRVRPGGWSEEMEILGTEFNEMLDRIQTMMQEEYQQKLLVERTEYKMLQAQINPHFLYNTLDTMSGIANSQNCTLVSGLCHSLSAIFRYSMNMKDELSTVQKEMAHVRNYLYVMDVRNGFTMSCEYRIDGDTLSDCLPRISLQPLVENAVNHGLRRLRGREKKLCICAEHKDGTLVITVSDNGVGMDAEELNELLIKNDIKRVESGVSIGILNVNARLKKLFGEKYGIRILSRAGEGTTVTLTVPIKEWDEND